MTASPAAADTATFSPLPPVVALPSTWPADMHVLQVLPRLGDGGVEQSTLEMAEWLQGQGIRNGVVSAGGAKTQALEIIGVPHFTMPVQRKGLGAIFGNAWRLRRLIRHKNVTLVHVRSRAPGWVAWLATRGLRVHGKPVVFVATFHGTYGAGNAVKRAYNRVMLRGPVVIANSQFIRAHLQTVYQVPAAQIEVAPRGIDPARFDPAPYRARAADIRASLMLPETAEQAPLILLVGRLTRWKGQHILLEALALIKEQSWHAVLVGGPEGDGGYARDLHARVSTLGLEDRVTFAGSRKDVPELLSISALAVSASIKAEAFGRVAIEAQAAGVPVVATALGGSLETVRDGDTGYLIAPNAPQEMAQKVGLLLTRPDIKATLGRNGYAWVRRHFTVANCCTREAVAYARAWAWREQFNR